MDGSIIGASAPASRRGQARHHRHGSTYRSPTQLLDSGVLQVNRSDAIGAAGAAHWVSIAQIDGAHAGDALGVLVDSHAAVHLAQIYIDLHA